jgi:transposase-like protein
VLCQRHQRGWLCLYRTIHNLSCNTFHDERPALFVGVRTPQREHFPQREGWRSAGVTAQQLRTGVAEEVVFSMWRWTEIAVTLSLVLIALRRKEYLMTCISVRCPHCHSEQIVKRGKTGCGTQRYLCQNTTCATGSFLLDYRYLGRLPAVKHQIIAMSLNASGVRDTARVLRISTDTVLRALKQKEPALESVNTAFLRTHNPDDIAVAIERAGEAEMDERSCT